jgi:hypothetical protein
VPMAGTPSHAVVATERCLRFSHGELKLHTEDSITVFNLRVDPACFTLAPSVTRLGAEAPLRAFQTARLLQATGSVPVTFAVPFCTRPDSGEDDYVLVIGPSFASWHTPTCLGRRMNQTTHNLLAHVLPAQPLRQWVLKEHLPRPGMQDGGDAKLGVFAEPLRVGGQGQERVGGRSEQECEDRGSVVAGQTVQLAGDGEDEVEVVDWQDALDASLDPAGLIERLALRTMAISARVVGGRLESAGGAEVEMAAERGRPARDDGACNVVLAFGQGVELAIVALVAAKDVRHLERRSHYLRARRASGVCWHQKRSAEDLARGSAEQVDGARSAVQMGATQVQIVGGRSDAGMPQ